MRLSIISTKGTRNTSNDVQEQKFETVNRTIHNSNLTNVLDDLSIESYEEISKPGDVHYMGNLQTFTSFCPEGAQETSSNNLVGEQVLAVESTADGAYIEEYETSVSQNVIINFSDYDINVQEYKRTLYFSKLRSQQLKVILKQTNFGLQRGTLLNVIIYEYDSIKKDAIIKAASNVGGQDETFIPDTSEIQSLSGVTSIKKDIIDNEGAGIPNPALCGLYYIDAMDFPALTEKKALWDSTMEDKLFFVNMFPGEIGDNQFGGYDNYISSYIEAVQPEVQTLPYP